MTEMKEKSAVDKEIILLVHIGKRVNIKEKLVDYFLEINQAEFDVPSLLPVGWDDEASSNSRLRVYTGKGVSRINYGCVGATYAITQVKNTHSVYLHESRYKGLFSDEAQREKWQVESRAEEARYKAFREGKKDRVEELASLVPFRQAYNRAVGRGAKAAVLAVVIAYITNGSVPKGLQE